MANDFDLLILGGGCAGLSLARELAHYAERCPSVCIVEQRAVYVNDRTWCFWAEPADPIARLVERRWSDVMLRSGATQVTVDFSQHPYCMISGSRFYADAVESIDSAPQIKLELAMRIAASPQWIDGWWHVETAAGVRRARQLVDTRPGEIPRDPDCAPLLWQSFIGHEINCDAAIFDASTVTLMDFVDADQDRIGFTYILPLSATRGLIEYTVFAAAPMGPTELALPLQRQVRARAGAHAFTLDRSEHGILPMGLPARKTVPVDQPGYVQVGLMHGAARPSTGYAFQRIQRWARDCAAALANFGVLKGHSPDSLPAQGMDRLFLALLRQRPELAPGLFLALFERTRPDRLARFLSDRSSLHDRLRIIAALPASPFIGQLRRSLLAAL